MKYTTIIENVCQPPGSHSKAGKLFKPSEIWTISSFLSRSPFLQTLSRCKIDSDTEFLSVSDDPQIHLLIDFNESKLARMTPELENKILDDSIVSLGVEVVVYQSNLRQFHCTG
ncbi:uncharacterized protein LOC129749779 [Uranotaenia lowii]|uniref:uncharacterized protein LOC129749779 n=1 Tax=Uranotaenia lowii TaxID=190385 RepID=UPI00247AE463|nr:uncharacterized protein LOC129749779 [Uranotaenia lowii]